MSASDRGRTSPVDLADIREAAALLAALRDGGADAAKASVGAHAGTGEPLIRRTRLVEAPGISDACGRRVLLKLESEQRCRCFKPRGALTFVLRALARDAGRRTGGLVTASSGNHGQAVALAAATVGLPALVVCPEDVRSGKRRAIEALGAAVEIRGMTSAERIERAREIRDERSWLFVPPYDHPDVIAGQGTVGLELAADAPAELAAACVPVGGGGLAAGIATALAALRPSVRLVLVEPDDADDAGRSLAGGLLVSNERPSRSECDGLRNTRLGDLPFEILRSLSPAATSVSDREVAAARRALAADGIEPVEPSGAATVAGVLAGAVGEPGETVVAVVSGGNA